ncbi:hypothetical protein ACFPYN_02925 [Paenisporosarcina macmurdoensis]|uniref:Uncharacterized protein n=1 Tax=Paenisporosarcina macmurdoensis TaxID=212659 RepID=A0ABW1L457_9BACL
MLYEVDFVVKTGDIHSTIRTAFVEAKSISECREVVDQMVKESSLSLDEKIHTYISEVEQ